MTLQSWERPSAPDQLPIDHIFEASELHWPPGRVRTTFRIGFECFVYVSTDIDSNGDATGWRYASEGHRVLVIND